MVLGLSLIVWAGIRNAQDRRLEAQREQDKMAAQVTLIPKGSTTDTAPSDNTLPTLEGKIAPAFNLVDLEGHHVTLADFKGKPVVVNFWATWCGPCKLEMPWFEEFGKKYAAQNLVILGLAADEAPKSEIASTAHKLGVTYPILIADDKTETAYGGIDTLPESFYVDRSGKITLQTAGVSSDSGGKDEIEVNIKKILEPTK
jgi:thiol-disulfide isomerase/thioredoxin